MNDIEAVAARVAEMARLAAARVDAPRLEAFRVGVMRRLGQYAGDHPCLSLWLAKVEEGPEAVRAALLDSSDDGRVMRSFAPLRTLITRAERDAIMARVVDDLAESP